MELRIPGKWERGQNPIGLNLMSTWAILSDVLYSAYYGFCLRLPSRGAAHLHGAQPVSVFALSQWQGLRGESDHPHSNSESVVGEALDLHVIDLVSILGTPYSTLTPTMCDL